MQVYLECKYEEKEFQEEKERLAGVKVIDEKSKLYNTIIKDMENSIVYINTQGIYGNSLLGLRFDKKYLPKDFMENIEYTGDKEKNFTIY